ncbi:MAG: DUF4432 family protein [Lentisphaerae bacterium]|nr:DUF4432 family protein [Lentisphaerota bacterium]
MTKHPAWQGKVSNMAQVAGIELCAMEDGPARGTRVAWVNTGSPLRFKVAVDRALDIVDAFHGAHSLAWLSHGGLVAPNPAAIAGLEWLRTFAGGLLTTCGLTHVGPPETDENGSRGLHGRVSNLPASLETVRQPGPGADESEMLISGTVRESRVFGPCLELHRTIACRAGEAGFRLTDRVTNRGNAPSPHMILYHCNFGWPLVDEGARLFWRGACRPRPSEQDRAVFNESNDYKRCPAPLPQHRGTGEACGFVTPEPETDGWCRAGVRNERLGLTAQVAFRKEQLPCLANWQHWGPGEYVTGIEPGTNFPIGQKGAAGEGTLIMLAPGEARTYELVFTVTA